MPSDMELLQRWRGGDGRAGADLFQRHFETLYRFFVTKAGSEAEDLVQRSFLAALEGCSRFRGQSSVRTWLLAIAHNILRQWIASRVRSDDRNAPLSSSLLAEQGRNASSLVDLAREHRQLSAALQRIPLDSQIVLELFYWEKLTAAEIGEVLDCPEGTVRGRIGRARQQLRAELDQLARTNENLDASVDGLATWAAKLAIDRAQAL